MNLAADTAHLTLNNNHSLICTSYIPLHVFNVIICVVFCFIRTDNFILFWILNELINHTNVLIMNEINTLT
jgi:hypothetical protein